MFAHKEINLNFTLIPHFKNGVSVSLIAGQKPMNLFLTNVFTFKNLKASKGSRQHYSEQTQKSKYKLILSIQQANKLCSFGFNIIFEKRMIGLPFLQICFCWNKILNLAGYLVFANKSVSVSHFYYEF